MGLLFFINKFWRLSRVDQHRKIKSVSHQAAHNSGFEVKKLLPKVT